MIKTYDDFCNSNKIESFVDYSIREDIKISEISKLIKNELMEDKVEDRIENENNLIFKGCMYGMLIAFSIMIFVIEFFQAVN